MNIALLIIDTLRYDCIGANGSQWVETPNIDAFAAGALAFDRAFIGSYPTIPFRTDVMRGRYGAPFFPWKPLRHDAVALPRVLAGSGYATQLIHDTPHLVNGGHNFDWPFHAWTPVRGAEVDRPWITDEVVWPENWTRREEFDALPDESLRGVQLCNYARANRHRKGDGDWNCHRLWATAAEFLADNRRRDDFFVWVDCFDPHEPWDAPPDFVRKYDATEGYDGRLDPRSLFHHRNHPDLSDAARQHIKAQYAAKLTWMDHCLGQFFDALEHTGLMERTAVILVADHGTNLDERGRFGKGYPVREQEARIPLFIRLPDGPRGRCRFIVQPQDLFATICGIAGVETPDGIQGHDLLDLHRRAGEDFEPPRSIALCGSGAMVWKGRHQSDDGILFTAFDDQWCLEVAAQQERCRLTRIGSLENVAADHPAIVAELYAEAVDELERRGAAPELMAWLRSGGELPWPHECRFWEDWPGPAGYYPYFQRLYEGDSAT